MVLMQAFLLDGQYRLDQQSRCRIVVGEEPDKFAIVIDGNPFSDEIFADHFREVRACHIL